MEPGEQVGLTAEGEGLTGALRWDDDDEGETCCPGDTEKVVGALRPSRLSSSLHTARLRLPPSAPPASSWQRSTKLPRRKGAGPAA